LRGSAAGNTSLDAPRVPTTEIDGPTTGLLQRVNRAAYDAGIDHYLAVVIGLFSGLRFDIEDRGYLVAVDKFIHWRPLRYRCAR
jgi:hypothetical protein